MTADEQYIVMLSVWIVGVVMVLHWAGRER